ncbi:hypothetical protein F511_16657 [Dorcoceras hygrometricum]|uniref:CID domain-containing protein n=1 Tax=Dorcoceras hygrometricum TaxID=472368 RepID=A0A2Z7AWD3_9LAMI|nr:hypothetical protein F511_16657 [Dorcoceras hygrometricum]
MTATTRSEADWVAWERLKIESREHMNKLREDTNAVMAILVKMNKSLSHLSAELKLLGPAKGDRGGVGEGEIGDGERADSERQEPGDERNNVEEQGELINSTMELAHSEEEEGLLSTRTGNANYRLRKKESREDEFMGRAHTAEGDKVGRMQAQERNRQAQQLHRQAVGSCTAKGRNIIQTMVLRGPQLDLPPSSLNAKNFFESSSARFIKSIGAPWFTLWKKPYSEQASLMISLALFLPYFEIHRLRSARIHMEGPAVHVSQWVKSRPPDWNCYGWEKRQSKEEKRGEDQVQERTKDTLMRWRTEPFIMITGSGRWIPPPLLIAKGAEHEKEAASTYAAGKSKRLEVERTLTDAQRDEFEDMLRGLTLERSQIKDAMGFALDNADAAGEIVEVLTESMTLKETPIPTKVARLMLVSDILHNSSAPVKNASAYRTKFDATLPDIMESFNDLYRSVTGRITAEALKERVLRVLQVWADWFLFSDTFVNGLRATFLRAGNSGVIPLHSICGDAPELERKSGPAPTSDVEKINQDTVLAISSLVMCPSSGLENQGYESSASDSLNPALDLSLALAFQEKSNDPRITSILKRRAAHGELELTSLLQDKEERRVHGLERWLQLCILGLPYIAGGGSEDRTQNHASIGPMERIDIIGDMNSKRGECGHIIWAKLTGHAVSPAIALGECQVGARKGFTNTIPG